MVQAKSGDAVKVHYTGKLDDGTVFDSSINRDPLEFTIGQERMIPDFEQAVIGMSLGESKTIKVPADKAFGPYHRELVRTIDRNQCPPDLEPTVGQKLNATHEDGQTVVVTVTDVTESNVTIDANHPLAGEDLTFDVKLVEFV